MKFRGAPFIYLLIIPVVLGCVFMGLLLLGAFKEKHSIFDNPSAESRCKYAAVDSTPLSSGTAYDIATRLFTKRDNNEALLVCAIHSYSLDLVGSMSYHDSGSSASVFVIWISDRVLKRAPPKILEFALAHEHGHHALYFDLCGDADDDKYVACEHRIDAYAANVVGIDEGIKALVFFNRLLLAEGDRARDVRLVTRRIDLMYQEMLHKQ